MEVIMKVFILTLFVLVFTCNLAFANDVQDIAKTIAAEAAGEGYCGMYLVANTIANRAKLYHKTPFQIVSARNQYYGYTAKNRNKIYLQVKKDADYLASNIMKLQDKTNGALYFRQLHEPKFKWCKIETIRYKHHIFYK